MPLVITDAEFLKRDRISLVCTLGHSGFFDVVVLPGEDAASEDSEVLFDVLRFV